MLSKQILKETPTEIRYIEQFVLLNEVNKQSLWNFELRGHEKMIVPFWIIFGFQQAERQQSQNLNNDTFYRLPVVSAQCVIGTEKYPNAGILLNYDDDDYSRS